VPHAARTQITPAPHRQQSAAGTTASGGIVSASYSAETLLGAVADRELANMRSEWERAGLLEYAAADLVRLAALITLMHGATDDELLTILGSDSAFSKLSLLVEKRQILLLLSSVLNTDEGLGLRALEPDLVGEIFSLRADIIPDTIATIYRIRPLLVGRAIWRIAADFFKDSAAQEIVGKWVLAVFGSLGDNAVALESFVNDNEYGISEILQPLLAEALAKITDALKDGHDTAASLLLGERSSVIPFALFREAKALVASRQLDKAAGKIQEARSALLSLGKSNAFLWFELDMIELDCKHAQGVNADGLLSVLDGAIEFCRTKILRKFF
jgi:hypothetical protein